jgi:uncharacterized membrane protein (UPF0127 family)
VTRTKLIVNLTRENVVGVAEIADRPIARMRGLMGREGLPAGEGVLITPAPSIHTGFMRFPIDVLFLDRDMHVLEIAEQLVPWRIASKRGARSVLELAAGESARLGLQVGDALGVREQAEDEAEGRRAPLFSLSGGLGRDWAGDAQMGAPDVVIASADRRFREAASVLLTRRQCAVTTTENVARIGELVADGRAHVVVLDSDQLPDATVGALPDAVGVVLVVDDPESSRKGTVTVAKWGPFDDLVAAIERADRRVVHGEIDDQH